MSHRILIADDNRDNADTIATILTLTGNETKTAYDGLSAVAAADEWHPDTIVFDINMPSMDGLEACRQIQRRQRPLAISMTGNPDMLEPSRKAGFDYHFAKPINVRELLRIVERT